MSYKTLYFKYGFIGEDLELKQDIQIEIDETGRINDLNFKDIESQIVREKLIVPGFINSHIHIGDSFAKEKGYNKQLKDVVAPPKGLKHVLLSKVNNLTKKNGVQHAALELISNGITYFIDFREEGEMGVMLLKDALKEMPIKYLIFGRYVNLDDIETIFDIADGIGLSSYKNRSVKEKDILKDFKKKTGKQVASHCAEAVRNENVIRKILEDQLVDIIVHGTKLLKKDLELIQKKKISLIICPRCNGYFGLGFPPLIDIINLKIPIAVGTDNIMANSPDLFEELRYLYRIVRILGNKTESGLLTAIDLLKMITINPARIFGMDLNIGSISKGKKADFFVIDLEDPNYHCQLNAEIVPTLIVQRTGSQNIKQVFIDGKLVFERNSYGTFYS